MSSLPQTLVDFIRACQRRFGQDVAQCNDDGAFVIFGETTVHVRLDLDAGRTVFWTDLEMPKHSSIEMIEHVAMDYTAKRFLDSGFVMGVNRAAGLIALGRSVDAAILSEDGAFGLMQDLAREATAATARFEQARSDAQAAHSQKLDPDTVTFRG